MKIKIVCAAIISAVLSGCIGKPIVNEPEATIWVDHHQTWVAGDPFNGYGRYVYRISNSAAPDFSAAEVSTADIIDFSYEQGYRYKLRVKKLAAIAADGLDTQYRLVAIEDKQPATAPFDLEIPKQQDFINSSGTIKFAPGSSSPAYNCVPAVCDALRAMPSRADIVFTAEFTNPAQITLIAIKSINGLPVEP